MALIPCPQCHELISDRSTICPECALPIRAEPKQRRLGWGIILGLVLVASVAAAISQFVISRKPLSRSPPVLTLAEPKAVGVPIDKSPHLQQERDAFIQRRVREGLFAKVDARGNRPEIWVTPRFLALSAIEKQALVRVVYEFYFDGRHDDDRVRVVENETGKEIGTYGPMATGLRLEPAARPKQQREGVPEDATPSAGG